MSMVILAEAVRPEEFPKYSAISSVVYTLSFGLGPLIGGGISSKTSWRWVFWLKYDYGFFVSNLLLTACG